MLLQLGYHSNSKHHVLNGERGAINPFFKTFHTNSHMAIGTWEIQGLSGWEFGTALGGKVEKVEQVWGFGNKMEIEKEALVRKGGKLG